MAVGSEQRRSARRRDVEALFAADEVEAVLDLLHLADMAWHDCYPGDLEVTPRVLEDVLLCAEGDLATLVRVTRQAVIDFRDVRMAADSIRAGRHR
jgi:hypothetical protein